MSDKAVYTADFIKSDTDEATFMENTALDHLMTALVPIGTGVWVQARRTGNKPRAGQDAAASGGM